MEDSTPSTAPPGRKIKKLDEAVINRIAAGEVILRPANALKEMMENSIDAGSKSISVLIKEGGLKLLQIQDDGSGIKKEDLDIVCERFTTSKLQSFDDLKSISTFGFRGEALASISHVAHVTITTKTADQPVAYKARYSDGKMIPSKPGGPAEPTPCAGKQGTQITVEDLFYNVLARKKALRSPNEEWKRIMDVVTRYAIHYSGVSFSLKKHGDTAASVHTQPDATVNDNIRNLFGAETARELLHLVKEDPGLQFKVDAYISNANYSKKKGVFILFINHRLVENQNIKKAIEGVYANYLPKKTHPFVYMALEMAPQNIDVNVHPTKSQVHFLREDTIIETIQKAVEAQLVGGNNARTFYAQAPGGAPTPGTGPAISTPIRNIPAAPHNDDDDFEDTPSRPTASTSANMTPQKKLVRTDDRVRTLDSFLTSSPASSQTPLRPRPGAANASSPQMLTSIQNLHAVINAAGHEGLTEVFKHHTFIGCINARHAIIQHRTKLYLCDIPALSKELFYQEGLANFGSFTRIRFAQPIPLPALLQIALDDPDNGWSEDDGPKEDIIEFILNLFTEKADMLREYFAIDIDDNNCLCALPQILAGYVPNMNELSTFALALGGCDWSEEQKCFESVMKELATFFAVAPNASTTTDTTPPSTQSDPLAAGGGGGDEDVDMLQQAALMVSTRNTELLREIQQVLLPAMRNLIPPKEFCNNGAVIQVGCLEDLYKIFERC